MSQPKSDTKIKILRSIWGSFPWLMVILFIILSSSLGIMLYEKKQRLDYEKKHAIKEESAAVKVITLEIEQKEFRDKINLPAVIESFENLWVKTEVSGQVVKILADEGRYVDKGQVLLKLDDRDYKLRLESIEANYDLAQLEYKRISELAEKKIAAVTDLDKISAQLKSLKSQLNEAKLAVERTMIKAPISGRLNKIDTEIGDWLGVDKPVAQILQTGSVKVSVGIPESDVASIFDLKEADITIEALGKRSVKGKKIFLSHSPGTLARLYTLELAVPNPDGRILPGMFARVEIVKKTFENAVVIPLYAVISRDDKHFVYLAENDVAQPREVKLGILDGWQIQVTEGLEPGEQVIVVGQRSVDAEQKLNVVRKVTSPAEITR